ncbi:MULTISPECIES: bacteriophage abortive infection AbiH family protein [Pacificibacter]|uniref:bacteriophage abortive infection AbiH family protein n=1 Tax=Pacificibacter TaxID=1042323 RepID=UPI001C09999F|nr:MULTISPECIES: bacteriophage abortive infection AbiH family protein [Pacificibacter]MBU2934799.1 bacteriophage abortive infection AbiH family protein [Pacificibacter marinus]MDO6615773.1 bacteriophage abortive infection AbiH family protein [Pacificibacter sp. 1_MG-2023]
MTELVIIGNGLDLHHGLKTSYGAFSEFAKADSPGIYELLSEQFRALHEFMSTNTTDDTNDFIYDCWCDFESSLGALDDERFEQSSHEDISEYMEELGMEETLVNHFINSISSILDVFRSWVSEIDLSTGKHRNFKFNTASAFVNFNYTETLETYYGVSREKILYIHGSRNTKDQLILGHDITPPKAQHKDDWPEIHGHPFYEYLRQTRKPVDEITHKLRSWLGGVPSIKQVSVRGHSLGTVDLPYFKMVAEAYPDAAWSFSYYQSNDLSGIQNAIRVLGIDDDRILSVATLSKLENDPNTSHNALTDQTSSLL